MRCLVLAVGLTLLLACPILGQAPVPTAGAIRTPNQNECRQGDRTLVAIFHTGLLIAVLAPLLMNFVLAPLGRRFWLFAKPMRRIPLLSLITLLFVLAIGPGSPWLLGPGTGWLASMPQSYLACADVNFGASGIFFGLVGKNQAAIALWLPMTLILIAATLVGCGITLLLQRVLAANLGIRRHLRRSAAA